MKRNKFNPNPQDEWFSADNGWDEASAQWENMDDWGSADADAQAQARPVRTSAPYIIQLVNACTTAIANVDVGDSYLQRAASNFGQSANITITSTISGVSYIEFLAQSESQPVKIGRTMVICTTAGQLDQTIAVTHRDASGNRADHIITPTVDPYQNQTDRIIDDYEYLFDGYTRLRFNQINASATVTLRMYPINKFVATQLIAGRGAEQTYGPPHIVKAALVQVKKPGLIR